MSLTKAHNRMIEGAVVNVKDFGAVGDGTTNDFAAVQAAIKHIQSLKNISLWYSDKSSSTLFFPQGEYLIDGTVLTVGNLTIKGDGATIISNNSDPTPVFETAYIDGSGNWISNASLPVVTLLADAITNLRFENLNFRSVGYVFKLRGATWQSHISDCSFYYCGRIVTANNCFYFNYERIMAFGTKSSAFNAIPKFDLSEAVNRVSFNEVSVSNFSSDGSTNNGIAIGISDYGSNINISQCSFELGQIAVQLTDTVNDLVFEDNYLESIFYAIKDTDGAIKRAVTVNCTTGYDLGFLTYGSGFRNSIWYAYQDRKVGLEDFKGVLELYAGTNSNSSCVVFQDSSWTGSIRAAKYVISGDVRLIPNDYNLEQGNNASGRFIKHPNGALICYDMVVTETCNTADTNVFGSTSGTIYRPSTAPVLNFPAGFLTGSIPTVVGNNEATGNSIAVNASNVTNTTFVARLMRSTTGDVTAKFMAVGRWK